MKVIYHPVQYGKTTKMIDWLRDNPKNMLITFSIREESRLRELYPDLANRIMAWENYQKPFTRNSGRDTKVAIDNADLILQRLCPDPIDTVTFTDFETEGDDGLETIT